MIYACIADVHAANHRAFGGTMEGGLNARCRATVKALSTAAAVAKQEGADHFAVLGDLVDTAKPEPQVLKAVGSALEYATSNGLVTVLKGNHDNVSDVIGDHALGPLEWINGLAVVETTVSHNDAAWIPFQAGMSSTWLPDAWARTVSPATRIVGLHLGIAEDASPAFLQRSPDAVTLDALEHLVGRSKVDFVVAGNWHHHSSWTIPFQDRHGCTVIQCGTFAPAGFDDALPFEQNAYGSMVLVDTTQRKWWRRVVPGLRFEKIVWAEDGKARAVAVAQHARAAGHTMFVRMTAEPRHASEARKWLASLTGITDFRVIPETASLQAQAKQAAQAVGSAESWAESVKKYVGKMDLPEDTKRNDVLARALAYLKG